MTGDRNDQLEQALRRGRREDEPPAGRGNTAAADAARAETTTHAAGRESAVTAPAHRADAAARAAARLSAHVAAEGLADVSYAPVDSPFGTLLAASTRKGLVRLAFPEEDLDGVLEALALRISPRIVEAAAPFERVRRELGEYFAGSRRAFELAQDWRLMGPFSKRVLGATYEIPYGAVSSYGEVAGEAGNPRGSRAAGNALGSNPIPIVVPCHRVLRAGGALGGYAGGPERKRWLLELEGALQRGR
jgi:methylated-DNA-[protein]-cysteine S-methyltransferase